MQHLIQYLRNSNPNAHELNVQDSIRLLQEIRRAISVSLTNLANSQKSVDEKLMLNTDIQYVETFFEMVTHSFFVGNQDTQLHDGVIVSKLKIEQMQETIQREIKNSHEHLKRCLESIVTIDDQATYGLNNLLDD